MVVENTNNTMRLPSEIVYEILSYQFRDLMSNDYSATSEKYHSNLKTFLGSNSTVNRTFNHVCRVLIYRYLNFTSAKSFHKLLSALREADPGLKRLVEVADFQELTSIGLGRTGEMNKMIKNLTNETLWEFLLLTKGNLREFLASEHMQEDIDERIIYFLLSPGTVLSVVDFCGCSGSLFTKHFDAAVERMASHPYSTENFQITCLGLNDCTDIPTLTLSKLLNLLPELQKLDLTHTAIDDNTLINDVPHWKNLTHLSFGECLQLTPRGVLEFFSYHPAVTDENNNCTLQWLNVQVHPHTSTWTETQTLFLLKKLCRYGHNKTLQYLNIGGLPLHYSDDATITKTPHYYQCQDTLQFIKLNFPELKSLNIRDTNVPYDRLVNFLSPVYESDINVDQRLKFLNISNNSYINRWTIQDPALFTCSKSLVALELSFDPWQHIEHLNDRHELKCLRNKSGKVSIIQDVKDMETVIWKCYIDSSYGRRYWLYKCDPYLNRNDIDKAASLTQYDSEGHKIIKIIKQPDFLKFAQNKIMLGCGIVPMSSTRRKKIYKDMKPPISRFFRRDGQFATFGTSTAVPILAPRLPPGGWRLIRNDDDGTTTEEESNAMDEHTPVIHNSFQSLSSIPETRPVLPTDTRDAVYWDRSVADATATESESDNAELDYDYFNDPELQRRRSQMSLFNGYHNSNNNNNNNNNNHSSTLKSSAASSMSNLTAALRQHSQLHIFPHQNCRSSPKNKLCRDFIYNANDPEMNKRYQIHYEQTQEYEVFGTVERGMYRYYSLKT